MANHDADVIVNVSTNSQQVDKQNFGLPLWATPAVDVGFTDFVREYRSNSDVQADVDLLAAAKAAGATHFSQENHPERLLIGKGVLEIGGAELVASLAAIQLVRDDWYGMAFDSRLDADTVALGAWLRTSEKFGIVQSSQAAILAGTVGNVFELEQAANNSRAAGLWHHSDAEYGDLAWLAEGLSINMDQEAGVWYDRTLVGPTVSDDDVTPSEKTNLEGDGGNSYLSQRGVGTVNPGKVLNGGFIDSRILKDWLIARVGERLTQFKINLANRNQKIPYNNTGFAMLRGETLGVMKRAEQIGHLNIDSTVVTVPDTFDPLSGIDPADVAERHFPYMTATATEAGSIRTIEITIGLLNT